MGQRFWHFETIWFGAIRTCFVPAMLFALVPGASWAGSVDAEDRVWREALRSVYFGNRPIIESDEVIELDVPVRAEDAAVVPVSIKAKFPQIPERFIRNVTVLIDKNPVPLAGKFQFTPQSGQADLDLRVRVNQYTPVRAIAETNDGKLHMTRRFVKASGGCSAPVGTDLETAMARLGKMRLATRGTVTPDRPALAQLLISHPNVTGMQMDQHTRLYSPAHFVKSVHVSFAGEPIFSAETDISISENPSFRFYFVPGVAGELQADVVDSSGLRFTQALDVTPGVTP